MSGSTNPLHVLFFVPSLGGGGAEMHLVRVVNHLDRSRFRVSVAVVRGGGSYEADLAPDVALHVLGSGRTGSATLGLIRSVGPLRRLLRKERPDVVCSVMDHASIATYAAARPLRNRLRIVASVQNSLSKYGRGGNPVRRLTGALIPAVYRRVDRVVALSTGVADEVAELLGGNRGRPEVIYNAGWDESVPRRAAEPMTDLQRPQGRALVVACGRLTEQKGYPVLLRAMQKVVERVDAELWIVGDGPLRGELEEQVRRLGLADRVRFLGFRRNPFQVMAAADVFALSSLWEGFGNVIVEAMASGAAVVATDCPHGPGEIVVHGESGLLVPPADPEAMALAILRLLEQPDLRAAVARGGRERAETYGAGTVSGRYGDLFASLVHRPEQGEAGAAT